MKVGLIVPGFSSDENDWCIPVLVDVVRELSKVADVHVFALRYPYRRARYNIRGATVHAIGGGETGGVRRVGLLFRACREVMAEHRQGSFDLLHGVWADEPGAVAVLVGRALRTPVVVSFMGGELVALPEIGYGGKLSIFNRVLTTLIAHAAGRLTGGSTQLLERIREGLPQSRYARSIRLPWGVNPDVFLMSGSPVELTGDFRILHVGSLVPVKDHGTLLRAMARLRQTQPGAHLHLVGDGPARSSLISQLADLGIGDGVTLHGHIPRHDLGKYYRSAHVLAVTSRHESQSVVVLEAALFGVPTVGTAVGLVRDFEPVGAIAVPIGDDAAMTSAFAGLVPDEARRAMGEVARDRVRNGYLASHTVKELLSLYRSLTGDADRTEMGRAISERPSESVLP